MNGQRRIPTSSALNPGTIAGVQQRRTIRALLVSDEPTPLSEIAVPVCFPREGGAGQVPTIPLAGRVSVAYCPMVRHRFPIEVHGTAVVAAGNRWGVSIREGGAMYRLRRSFVVLVVIASGGLAAAAGVSASAESPVEEHCVVEVVDQLPSGEFVLSEPECFDSFASAALRASSGTVRLAADATPGDLERLDGQAALLSTFTLGVHYDGYNGTGSSISVVGSVCGGGYWNTPTAWDNKISSTWNGCNRIKHHDNPNTGGSYGSTWGVGSTSNVPSALDNKAESISYWN